VKILLDECVGQRFRKELIGHEVITVPEAGWADKKNGELLALAATNYQVFITVDSKTCISSRIFPKSIFLF
jgi:predicted nuclease of predicted toxin-antitoxin system